MCRKLKRRKEKKKSKQKQDPPFGLTDEVYEAMAEKIKLDAKRHRKRK